VFSSKRGALLAVIAGFAALALGAQTLQAWAPTMFVRIHHWNVGGAGQRFGVFTFVLGPLGALTGAFLADAFERTGRPDGKLLVGLLSAIFCLGMSVLATLPSEGVAFFGVVGLQFFVAFNFGLVQAAIAELLPNQMRALGSACYVATTNLVTATLGPLIVGLLNDHVFHDPNMVAVSVRCVTPAAFVLAALVLAFGLRSYRNSVTGRPSSSSGSNG
jgi:MFS family permease